jgi:hypothetical protein
VVSLHYQLYSAPNLEGVHSRFAAVGLEHWKIVVRKKVLGWNERLHIFSVRRIGYVVVVRLRLVVGLGV